MRNYKKIIVLSIFLMLFGEAFGETLVGSAYRYLFVSANVVMLAVYLMIGKTKIDRLDRFPVTATVLSWVLLLVSILFWDFYHNIYSYAGIFVAMVAYLLDFKYANKLIVWLVYLSLGLTAFEFFTHKLLFVNTIRGIEFDEYIFGGSLGVFRAKGLFYGPTVLGMFMVTAFLLNSKNVWLLLAAILSCFFANARLGIVLLAVPFLFLLFRRKNLIYLFPAIVLCIFLIGYTYTQSASVSLERFAALAESGSQSARLYFWEKGIELFSNYPLKYILFGNNGYYSYTYQNNPESGWICLLTDNGITGFLFYLLPLLYCLDKFVKRKEWNSLMLTAILIAFNFAITGHLSGTGNLMYWLVVFELYNKARYGYGKLDKITLLEINLQYQYENPAHREILPSVLRGNRKGEF